MNRLFFFVSLLLLSACQPKITQNSDAEPVPAALQKDDGGSLALLSKRGYEDIVEQLYAELLEKDKDLYALNKEIGDIGDAASDSMSAFNKYFNNCENYYRTAQSYSAQITDSFLKKHIENLIATGNNKFRNITAADTVLRNEIAAAQKRLADAHLALKIVKTLPIMDKYAKDQHPSPAPMQALKKNYEALEANLKKQIW